jgi:hypothetical protein
MVYFKFFFETHTRHIGHIVFRNNLYKSLKIKQLYINLCILCSYVFQKNDLFIIYSLHIYSVLRRLVKCQFTPLLHISASCVVL